MINRFNAYYYLLFMLLVFGAFASMAQNHYGIQILGGVALAFSATFFVQAAMLVRSARPDKIELAELASLFVLSIILFMRVFYLRFPFVEVVFGVAGAVLIGSYLAKTWKWWNTLKTSSKSLAAQIIIFLSSIMAYAVSLTIVPFASAVAEPAGIAGFVLLLVFVAVAIRQRDMLVEGERISAFQFLPRLNDRSIVLATLFLLFTAYIGLTRFELIPKMYLDQYPQAYYELVNRSETGAERPINGKFRHEVFKEEYDRFVERYTESGK